MRNRFERLLDIKIDDYNSTLEDLISSNESNTSLIMKYNNYIDCLTTLRRELVFNSEDGIYETLIYNYGKFDTEIIFIDDSTYVINKDDILSYEYGLIMIHNKNEFLEDKTIIPTVEKILNVSNIKLIHTIKE